MQLLLCSASPRRRELLARLGLSFETIAPQIDEARAPGEEARALPLRLAQVKASAGLAIHRARCGQAVDALALAADTVVSLGEVELGKPRDRAHARELLAALSGVEHTVTTAVCAMAPRRPSHSGEEELEARSCVIDTKVRFKTMTAAQLDWLAASGDGDDKAGGYGIQGLAGAFIERIDGSHSNVIGLPLAETLELISSFGFPLPWSAK